MYGNGPAQEGERSCSRTTPRHASSASSRWSATSRLGRYPYPPALGRTSSRTRATRARSPSGSPRSTSRSSRGPRRAGRQNMFSSGFLPIAEPGSEFALQVERPHRLAARRGAARPDRGLRVPAALLRAGGQQARVGVALPGHAHDPGEHHARDAHAPRTRRPCASTTSSRASTGCAPSTGIISDEEGFYARLAALLGQGLRRARGPRTWCATCARSSTASPRRGTPAAGTRSTCRSATRSLTYVTIFGFEHARGLAPSLVDAEVGRIWGEFVVTQGEGARGPTSRTPRRAHTAPLPKLKNLAKAADAAPGPSAWRSSTTATPSRRAGSPCTTAGARSSRSVSGRPSRRASSPTAAPTPPSTRPSRRRGATGRTSWSPAPPRRCARPPAPPASTRGRPTSTAP